MSVEGVDATEAAIVASMLASDNVPDENQSVNCLSCGAKMQGLHCVECGQKNDNYRRSIFALLSDLFGSVFSLESRIWRSWGALLFRPGQVPREFADGRRTHWSSPVRVYLAISIILFGFMGATQTHLVSLDANPAIKSGIEKSAGDLVSDDIEIDWNVNFFEQQKNIDARNLDRNFSLLGIWLEGEMVDDREVAEKVGTEDRVKGQVENISEIGLQSEREDEGDLWVKINGKQVGSADVQKLLVNFIKSPAALTHSFNKWLPRLMFIMMPFTMLFGALFIRDREKGLLFDHLVHAAYIHAFAFFLLFMGILVSKIMPAGWVFGAIAIVILIYLPLSLKRMFGRGWPKTIFTSYAVGLMYALVMTIALSLLMIWDLSAIIEV